MLHEFKQPELKGFDGLDDPKHSLRSIINAAHMAQRNVSEHARAVSVENGKKQGPIQGKKNVESGHLESLRTPEHQSKAAKAAGKVNVESGHWDNVIELGKQWRIDNPELAHQISSDSAKRMNESLSPEYRKQHNTKVARKIYIMSDGFVLKNPFVKSKYEKENQGVSVVDSFIESDDQYDYYNNIINERKEQERLDKLKPKPCKHCGIECNPKGLHSHEQNCKSKTK